MFLNFVSGPSHWGKDYKTCVGKYQSPIDIKDKDVTITTFPLLQFSNVDSPQAAYMINNGHTGTNWQGQDIDKRKHDNYRRVC